MQHTEIVSQRDLNHRLNTWAALGVEVEKKLLDDGTWLLTITPPGEPADRTVDDPNPITSSNAASAVGQPLGSLSARYESGSRSSSAIGQDSTGGPSYGKYQIATKTGTFKRFVNFLAIEAPDIHARFEAAGGASAALQRTPAFEQAWLAEAGRGSDLSVAEHGFIRSSHYSPFVSRLNSIGLHVARRSAALKDVVWSVAVQHGPANNVVSNALSLLPDPEDLTDDRVIRAIYQERSNVNKYFSSSTAAVKKSVKSRFADEKKRALAMYAAEKSASA